MAIIYISILHYRCVRLLRLLHSTPQLNVAVVQLISRSSTDSFISTSRPYSCSTASLLCSSLQHTNEYSTVITLLLNVAMKLVVLLISYNMLPILLSST
jgi:hypothetical protein